MTEDPSGIFLPDQEGAELSHAFAPANSFAEIFNASGVGDTGDF